MSRELEKSAEKIGTKTNPSKTVLMELIYSDSDSQQRKGLTFEKVVELKYLGATLSTNNDWSNKIKVFTQTSQKKSFMHL